jgi:WD40 repeat protein
MRQSCDVVGALGRTPDGPLLLVVGNGTMQLWDPATGMQLGYLYRGRSWVTAAFGLTPDGRLLLASGSQDGRCNCGTQPRARNSANRSPAVPRTR